MRMRQKWYVTFGKYRVLLLAVSEYQAAIIAFKRYLNKYHNADRYHNIQYMLPTNAILSQRGFDFHSDDIVISTGEIIRFIERTNEQ